MLIIRLQRTGKRNQPLFRVVLTEKRAPIKGKYIERLGFINPEKKEYDLNSERIKYWLSKGASPSDTVYNLLVVKQILPGPKRKIKIKKKRKKVKKEKEREKPRVQKREKEEKKEEKREEKKITPEEPKSKENQKDKKFKKNKLT